MALHPQVRKQQLKLRALQLTHRSKIADHRDALKAVNEQLKQLRPKKKEEVSLG